MNQRKLNKIVAKVSSGVSVPRRKAKRRTKIPTKKKQTAAVVTTKKRKFGDDDGYNSSDDSDFCPDKTSSYSYNDDSDDDGNHGRRLSRPQIIDDEDICEPLSLSKKKTTRNSQRRTSSRLGSAAVPSSSSTSSMTIRSESLDVDLFDADVTFNPRSSSNQDISYLPPELWTYIFALASNGSIYDILKLTWVCRRFRGIVLSNHRSRYWTKMDLDSGRLKKESLTEILDYVRPFIGSQTMEISVSRCSQMKDIQIEPNPNSHFSSLLSKLMEGELSELQCLYLNGNWVSQPFKLYQKLTTPTKLRVLDLSGIRGTESMMNLQAFINATPDLITLRCMECPIFFSAPKEIDMDGKWTKLKRVDISYITKQHAFAGNHTQLIKVIRKCPSIRELRMGYIQEVHLLHPFQSTSIKTFSAPNCIPNTYLKPNEAVTALMQFEDTVKELDLSWCGKEVVFSSLFQNSNVDYPLKKLHLVGSGISTDHLVNILSKCRKLEFLDLSSCKSLPRIGCKRPFTDSNQITELFSMLRRSHQ